MLVQPRLLDQVRVHCAIRKLHRHRAAAGQQLDRLPIRQQRAEVLVDRRVKRVGVRGL